MAKQKKSHKGIVPVSSRERATETRSATRAPFRLGSYGLIALFAVVLLILLMIAIPLRNYFQQRTEIARVEAAIEAKQEQINQLETDLDRYRSQAYIREQARLRLGLIEPGETAFRILDPALDNDQSLTSDGPGVEPPGPWYETLWESVTRPEPPGEQAADAPEAPAQTPAP
ncbi:FtsB family cell division protein [Corynebacterium pacaense]|uniref:FtsB family cell division protein n=1 Tax=Corynebacterium pacaense TaxID=1816684 RepID=UPI0009BC7006|nr:septum formation initiator family protein [Corynebacterium pacaense]